MYGAAVCAGIAGTPGHPAPKGNRGRRAVSQRFQGHVPDAEMVLAVVPVVTVKSNFWVCTW